MALWLDGRQSGMCGEDGISVGWQSGGVGICVTGGGMCPGVGWLPAGGVLPSGRVISTGGWHPAPGVQAKTTFCIFLITVNCTLN